MFNLINNFEHRFNLSKPCRSDFRKSKQLNYQTMILNLTHKRIQGCILLMLLIFFISGEVVLSYTLNDKQNITEEIEKGEEKSEKEKEEKNEKNKEEFCNQTHSQAHLTLHILRPFWNGHYALKSTFQEVFTPPPEC